MLLNYDLRVVTMYEIRMMNCQKAKHSWIEKVRHVVRSANLASCLFDFTFLAPNFVANFRSSSSARYRLIFSSQLSRSTESTGFDLSRDGFGFVYTSWWRQRSWSRSRRSGRKWSCSGLISRSRSWWRLRRICKLRNYGLSQRSSILYNNFAICGVRLGGRNHQDKQGL